MLGVIAAESPMRSAGTPQRHHHNRRRRPVHPVSGHLSAEYRDLVPQHQ
jgi:hypothetical protein